MCFANIDGHQKLVKSFLSIPKQDGLSVQCVSEQNITGVLVSVTTLCSLSASSSLCQSIHLLLMAGVGAVKTSDGYLTAKGFTMGKLSPVIRWPCQKK